MKKIIDLSVIIPFYKGNSFLPALLSSLNRSYIASKQLLSIEIILVIDSEETTYDEIAKIVEIVSEKITVNIIKNEYNEGVDCSRDKGMDTASGNFVTFIDQDDFVNTEYFTILEQNLMSSGKDAFLLNGEVVNIITNKSVPIYYRMPVLQIKSVIMCYEVLTPSLLVLKKSLLVQSNIHFTLPFKHYKGIDDWYFVMQLLILHPHLKIKRIDKKLINYCIHSDNYSHNLDQQIGGAIAVLKSINPINKKQKKYIKQKIRMLQFSESFYLEGKIRSILRHPLLFCLFIRNYARDYNRLIRFIHRNLNGLKIKRNK